jgi:hypothetical protein
MVRKLISITIKLRIIPDLCGRDIIPSNTPSKTPTPAERGTSTAKIANG